jgi:hypothetical protein
VTFSLNLNRANYSEDLLNIEINHLIETAAPPTENWRRYLGVSAAGSPCLRKIQFDWMADPVLKVRSRDIFARGHFFEEQMRQHLITAGFVFAGKDKLGFSELGGLFRGHADGIILSGPLTSLMYPCIWEAKCLNAKGWRSVEKDGLRGIYDGYVTQVNLYQAYLDLPNPALFSVVNADTAEKLFFLVSFDAQRAQMMSDRALTVIEATKAGELLSRAYDDPNDWHCKLCSHTNRCWKLG